MVAAFSYIFLGFFPSRMFMRHVPVIGVSWRTTLIAGVHTLNYIHHVQEGVPPWTILSFVPYLWDFNWEYLIIICSALDLPMSSDKTQSPIYDLGPSPLQLWYKLLWYLLIWEFVKCALLFVLKRLLARSFGSVWLYSLNNSFLFLNNKIHIFTIFFHLHVFSQYLNNVIRTILLNGSFFFWILWFGGLWDNYKFWRGQNELLWGLNFFFSQNPKEAGK